MKIVSEVNEATSLRPPKNRPCSPFCAASANLTVSNSMYTSPLSKRVVFRQRDTTNRRHLVHLDSLDSTVLAFDLTLDVFSKIQIPVAFSLPVGQRWTVILDIDTHSSGLNMLLTMRYFVGSWTTGLDGLEVSEPRDLCSLVPAPRRSSRSVWLLPGQLEHELLPCIVVHSWSTSSIVDLIRHLLGSLLESDNFDYQ